MKRIVDAHGDLLEGPMKLSEWFGLGPWCGVAELSKVGWRIG